MNALPPVLRSFMVERRTTFEQEECNVRVHKFGMDQCALVIWSFMCLGLCERAGVKSGIIHTFSRGCEPRDMAGTRTFTMAFSCEPMLTKRHVWNANVRNGKSRGFTIDVM